MSLIPPPVDGAAAVRFDPAVAQALAVALDDLAWHLDALRDAEAAGFERALVEWRGPTATWAAGQRPELTEQVQRLARRCEEAAAEARASVGRAADSQASRNASATVTRHQAEARAALGEVRTR